MLTVSRSEHVKSWEKLTVQRAFQWAHYFQHLYRRFHGNNPVRAALEQRLRDINQKQKAMGLGDRTLYFPDLGSCAELLWGTLLQNPALPLAVCQHLLLSLGTEDDGDPIADSVRRSLRQKNASMMLLSITPSEFCGRTNPPSMKPETSTYSIGKAEATTYLGGQDKPSLFFGRKADLQFIGQQCAPPGASTDATSSILYDDCRTMDPVAKTQASVLSKHLDERTKYSSLSEKEKLVVVKEILALIPRPLVFKLVGLMLASSISSVTAPLLMQWLMDDHNLFSCFCSSLDCNLLTGLSSKYPKFRDAYLELLASWGRDLEYSITSGQWTCNSPEVSWESLQHHYSWMLKGSTDTKAAAERMLITLKIEDGDFNVRGISVWTDLLSCLRSNLTF
ncbi:hypothetical protein NDU88_001272 [Pleurodeles waltl]|uniref:Uncharacterized protein n=2 Tax=Pleurodeles waltl TaxID=8319 RepID=A0AAV7LFF1_PLEWA|nr:hypothetical protein NDU88_001272 [Pleurodeles waltl]